MSSGRVLYVPDHEKASRIDVYLAKHFSDQYSRMTLKRWIIEGRILVNGGSVKPNYQVMPGDTIRVDPAPPPVDFQKAEEIALNIIYEDEDLLVVNKSAGMVVHPGAGNKQGTLVNALLHHCQQLSLLGGSDRPGIVHRLDKNTSGLLAVAKNDWTHERLAKQFRDRTARRIYQCVVKGIVQHDEGCFTEPIARSAGDPRKMRADAAGKPAVTYFTVVKRFSRATSLEARIMTGRTHQIRVHMAYHSHPVLGDLEYGVRSSYINRQALHAGSLELIHPRTQKGLTFHAPLPEDFQHLLDKLNAEDRR